MTHALKKITVVVVLLLLCAQALPRIALADIYKNGFTATYTVSKGILTLAYTTRRLVVNGNGQYTFESFSKPSTLGKMFADGEITERSSWTFYEDYPRPMVYTYKNTTPKKRREVELLFDWEKKSVTNIINGDPWKMELTNGVQDKLLYQLSLMVDLANNKNPLQYQVADGGILKTYNANIVGKEVIETDIGKFDTIKVKRESESRMTTFWCAPELDYLPVLIEHEKKDGGTVEARLSDMKGFRIKPDF